MTMHITPMSLARAGKLSGPPAIVGHYCHGLQRSLEDGPPIIGTPVFIHAPMAMVTGSVDAGPPADIDIN